VSASALFEDPEPKPWYENGAVVFCPIASASFRRAASSSICVRSSSCLRLLLRSSRICTLLLTSTLCIRGVSLALSAVSQCHRICSSSCLRTSDAAPVRRPES
jgi:hypothetical protein